MTLSKLLAAGTIVALSAGFAQASDGVLPPADATFTKWGEVEGWTLYQVAERKSCMAERVDANGNVLQMGLTPDHSLGYLGIFTQADIGLQGGKEDIFLDLDGNLYKGQIQKKSKHLSNGYTGGYVLAKDAQFIEDVMKKYEMSVMPEHENSFTVDLKGTFKAIEEARKCNEEISG